jgi:hypothetical protein
MKHIENVNETKSEADGDDDETNTETNPVCVDGERKILEFVINFIRSYLKVVNV